MIKEVLTDRSGKAVAPAMAPERTHALYVLAATAEGGSDMKVSEIMTSDVHIVAPDDTIQEAARKMEDTDVGFLPVGENDRLIGMVTDRDIALRAVAQGKDPKNTKVRDVMTSRVLYCTADEEVEEIASNMADLRIRRLPIVNKQKRLVGVVSIGDIAFRENPERAGHALESVVTPNGGANAPA
jgi:CBS domain-containing protein